MSGSIQKMRVVDDVFPDRNTFTSKEKLMEILPENLNRLSYEADTMEGDVPLYHPNLTTLEVRVERLSGNLIGDCPLLQHLTVRASSFDQFDQETCSKFSLPNTLKTLVIVVEDIDRSWPDELPEGLESISLSCPYVTGPPTFPSTLKHLSLSGEMMSGKLEFPDSIETIDLHFTTFIPDFDLEYKPNLRTLRLHGNDTLARGISNLPLTRLHLEHIMIPNDVQFPETLTDLVIKLCRFESDFHLPPNLINFEFSDHEYNGNLLLPPKLQDCCIHAVKFNRDLILPKTIRLIDFMSLRFDKPIILPPSLEIVTLRFRSMTHPIIFHSPSLERLTLKAKSVEKIVFPAIVKNLELEITIYDRSEIELPTKIHTFINLSDDLECGQLFDPISDYVVGKDDIFDDDDAVY